MAEMLLLIFLLICFSLLGTILLVPRRLYEYPYFMAVGFAVFILPQLISLSLNTRTVPPGAYETLLFMSSLCLGMCWLGYRVRPNKWFFEKLIFTLNPQRFFLAGAFCVGISFIFYYLISDLTEQETGGSQWTGVVTIYHFFSQLIYLGFSICFFSALRQPKPAYVFMSCLAALPPLRDALVYGRREPTVLFLVIIGMGLLFWRQWVPPRWSIITFALASLIAINTITPIRIALQEDNPWQAVRKIDFIQEFKSGVEDGHAYELRNAAFLIYATQITNQYQLGSVYWDQMVKRFVPAQWFGHRFKEALQFNINRANAKLVFGYDAPVGTTFTGIADAFVQFGYLGCFFFAFLGWFFKNLWVVATYTRNPAVQICYVVAAISALRSVTHETADFLPGLFYVALFMGLVTYYARETA